MLRTRTFLALISSVILLGWTAAQSTPPLTPNLEWKGRLVVEFADAPDAINVNDESDIALIGHTSLDALANQYNIYQIRKLFPTSKQPENLFTPDISRYYILEFPPEMNLQEIIASYEADPAVLSAEPYAVYPYLYVPNDPLFASQWALTHIGAEIAYDYCLGSEDVIFGAVDCGIDTMHEDLRGNLWVNPGEDLNGNGIIDPVEWNNVDDDMNGFIDDFGGGNMWENNNNVQESYPSSGHGTFVAGCASAETDNSIGIASIGCEAEIMTLKAGDGIYIYAGPESIMYCIENGADVINLSWGGPIYYQFMQAIISYGWSEGLIFVAAAGSDGGTYPLYPAAYDHVIGVGSTDQNDHLALFTNYGDWVDVFAPGINILSTFPGNIYNMWSGTSGSSPIVAGLACLIWAADPTLSNEEVVQHILSTSVNIDSLNPGHEGLLRIDAGAALAGLFLDVVLTPENPPIVIPANGGSFNYNIMGSNSDDVPHTFDCWCDVTLPDGSHYGPVLGPVTLTLSEFTAIDRDRTQNVPANAPAGSYVFNAYIGTYPGSIACRDSIEFEKLAFGNGDRVTGWFTEGESLKDETYTSVEAVPSSLVVENVHPNPFNPATKISYSLLKAGKINLSVYNLSGQLIKTLAEGWKAEGSHDVIFDGSSLASGIYVYRLQADDFITSGKLALIR